MKSKIKENLSLQIIAVVEKLTKENSGEYKKIELFNKLPKKNYVANISSNYGIFGKYFKNRLRQRRIHCLYLEPRTYEKN